MVGLLSITVDLSKVDALINGSMFVKITIFNSFLIEHVPVRYSLAFEKSNFSIDREVSMCECIMPVVGINANLDTN